MPFSYISLEGSDVSNRVQYSKTMQKPDGSYETRVHTDYTQTVGKAAGEVAGNITYVLLSALFRGISRSIHSMNTFSLSNFGRVLLIIGFITLFASAWGGVLLMLCGGSVISWGYYQRSKIREEANRASTKRAQ